MVPITDCAAFECIACKGSVSFFGSRAGYSYFTCDHCGTLQLCPIPNDKEISYLYERSYTAASHYEEDPIKCNREARPYFESIKGVLMDYEVSGPILDCGAGWGGLCRLLNASGFVCRGVEPSAEMSCYCKKQGLPVSQGGIETITDEKFSAILLCTVFEHLTAHDSWLQEAHSLLIPGGLIVSLQPTARFATVMGIVSRMGRRGAPLPGIHRLFSPPWHVAFFSILGMEKIAARNGFLVLDIRPAPQGRSAGLLGSLQRSLEMVNKVGTMACGVRWPFLVAHTFVLKKVDQGQTRY